MRSFRESTGPYDPRRLVAMAMPYENQTVAHLEIDSGAEGDTDWRGLLDQLIKYYETEEMERVIRGAALLLYMECGTVAECLHTAMIWERG